VPGGTILVWERGFNDLFVKLFFFMKYYEFFGFQPPLPNARQPGRGDFFIGITTLTSSFYGIKPPLPT
jgi:hypothetical protein